MNPELSTEQKRQMLAQLLRDGAGAPRSYPVSFAQQRLWLLDQLEPGSDFYNLPTAIRLEGALDKAALTRTLNEVVRRHAILRTTFTSVEGRPLQIISPQRTVLLPVIDLGEFHESKREAEARRLVNEEARRPFDLSEGPLLRATLLRLSDEDHVVLFTMHHIVSDGWSRAVLINEIKTLYGAYNEGRESPLPELSIQYADFAVWQRQWLQGEVLDEQLNYWRKQLGGDLSPLQLPTDRPRPPIQSYRGATQTQTLSGEPWEKLAAIPRRYGVTLFMTLLAAFQALLSRYSGQTQIAIGTPIANRTRAETEALIGFFVNTLVLRTDLSGDPTFAELLGRVKEVTLGAYEHQDVPFEKLVEELQPERNLSRSPLFQVMFALLNTPRERLELPLLKLSSFKEENQTAKFDLSLTAQEGANGLALSFEYSTDLFDSETITRMLWHLKLLLEGVAANPDLRLSQLPLLTAGELNQLLVEWNDTHSDYSHNECIHHLFEEQVRHTPDQIAVVHEDRSLSYEELNSRANRLAHYLRRLGVKPELRVGICTERSFDMIVAALGVLKAGGTYVPLDPQYPADRVSLILSDGSVKILLTQKPLLSRLPEYPVQLICLDTELEGESSENPDTSVRPENTAYLIYTSGSTGGPKGVMIEHRSIVNFTLSSTMKYEFSGSDRILQFASLTFDTSAEEIFPCLTCGATLVLRTDSMLASVETFLNAVQEQEITVLDLPTAYWHEMTAQIVEQSLELPALRLVIIGGEKAMSERLALWRQHIGNRVRLMHGYGPTEVTICATIGDLPASDIPASEVSIGRPMHNIRTYILDRYLRPVSVGVTGELCVSGVCLARGYSDQPDVTAERFIPNPFGVEPGERLYKTGDLARHRRDGQIECVGRVDGQVKVRGYRVELGEIEAAINRHAAVHESVVIAREDNPGDRRLVAYVVNGTGPHLVHGELRKYLKRLLPEYMMPSAFVVLDRLPLTVSGKVDRQSLPAPSHERPELESTFTPACTDEEEKLAKIWCDVLKLDQVGVDDNFFELGGHSLLATQVVSRVRDVFRVELPLRSLFETPTVSGLAATISELQTQPDHVQATAIIPQKRTKNL